MDLSYTDAEEDDSTAPAFFRAPEAVDLLFLTPLALALGAATFFFFDLEFNFLTLFKSEPSSFL